MVNQLEFEGIDGELNGYEQELKGINCELTRTNGY